MMDRSSSDTDGQADVARAEEMVDAMARRVAGFVSRLGFEIMKGVALAREEAEDILAEAQTQARRQ